MSQAIIEVFHWDLGEREMCTVFARRLGTDSDTFQHDHLETKDGGFVHAVREREIACLITREHMLIMWHCCFV